MKNLKEFIIIIVLITIGVFVWAYFSKQTLPTQTVKPTPYHDKIEVYDLVPGTILQPSPVTFLGRARGIWFFEASFPVKILDGNGNLLGTGIAQAQSDWMTENYVEFKVDVAYSKPSTKEGVVEFIKDNPSGLPEHDDMYLIPIKFP